MRGSKPAVQDPHKKLQALLIYEYIFIIMDYASHGKKDRRPRPAREHRPGLREGRRRPPLAVVLDPGPVLIGEMSQVRQAPDQEDIKCPGRGFAGESASRRV